MPSESALAVAHPDERALAFVQCERLAAGVPVTRGAAAHGPCPPPAAGLDPDAAAAGRVVLHWCTDATPVDVALAHDLYMRATGARERKGTARGLRLHVGISLRWLAAAGSTHDPANPRVVALSHAAVEWAQTAVGGVFAAYYDLSRIAGGGVHIFAAPLSAYAPRRASKASVWTSVNAGLTALAERHGLHVAASYRALRTSWATHAADRFGPEIAPAHTPRNAHGRDDAKGSLEAAWAEVAQARATLDTERAELAAERARLEALRRSIDATPRTPPTRPSHRTRRR